jgi:PTS system nitrogen regulatory IIA component
MQLGVRDAAGLMNVSEKTIYRWIKQNKLPAYRINEQYRFSRAELLEWATAQKINVSAEIFGDSTQDETPFDSLADALRGSIHYRVGGTDKTSVLESVIQIMPLPQEVDRTFLLKVLLARETMGSTAIGGGIAIPHVRNPIVMHITKPVVTLCFLETPIDFGALDGKPVHTLFAIISPTIRSHLSVLARLTFALRQSEFAAVISSQGSRDAILQAVANVDASLNMKNKALIESRGSAE